MKNFHQNLLVILALSLCLLCVYQWHSQTRQRNDIQTLNQLLYDKSLAIQGYTNSIKTMDHQIAEMDARISELKEEIKTNAQTVLAQKQEMNRLQSTNIVLGSQVTQYVAAVNALEAKLKDAYDGVKKQNDAIKELITQRDEYVKKLNDSVNERNEIVKKYNDLVQQVEKLQGGKPTPK